MPVYRLFGLLVESNLPFAGLPAARGETTLKFEFQEAGGPRPVPSAWHELWHTTDGEVWLSVAPLDQGYLLRFHGMADFEIAGGGGEVSCDFYGEASDAAAIEHVFLNHVMPLVLCQRGRLVIHASAVVGPTGAVLFLGEAGVGKSTLATSLCRLGNRLLADDSLVIEEDEGRLVGVPSYPCLRVGGDVASALAEGLARAPVANAHDGKEWVMAGTSEIPFCEEPVPVSRVFVMEPREGKTQTGVEVSGLPRRQAFMEVFKAAYRLEVHEQARLRREFESISRVAGMGLFQRLVFPHDLASLSRVHEAIFSPLEGPDTRSVSRSVRVQTA